MPGTLAIIFAAIINQIVFDGRSRERLARENKIEFLRPRVLVKGQPSQSLFSSDTRGNFKRNVSLKVVARFIEVGVRIDHDRLPAIRRVENIKIAISVGLDQKA